jgi:hypothetical protein
MHGELPNALILVPKRSVTFSSEVSSSLLDCGSFPLIFASHPETTSSDLIAILDGNWLRLSISPLHHRFSTSFFTLPPSLSPPPSSSLTHSLTRSLSLSFTQINALTTRVDLLLFTSQPSLFILSRTTTTNSPHLHLLSTCSTPSILIRSAVS